MDGINNAGNRRGMSAASRANLEAGAKPGFGSWSRRNLHKCLDIFYWGCRRSRGLNPVTAKEGYMAACFITLTVPDLHEVIDSKHGYEKLLKGFIKWMVATFGVTSYIWKFEWQERGQGHWHIFADKFCNVSEMRKEWIRRLGKAGLVRDWGKSHSYDPIYACKIKGLKSAKEVKEYLLKYMYKSSQNGKGTEGRVWGASMWIKKSKRITLPVTDTFMTNLDLACAVQAIQKMDITVPDLAPDGSEKVGMDGKIASIWIGTSFWSNKYPPEFLLCNEQQKYYNEYIKAYQNRDWERTIRLSYDLWKIERDFHYYTESREYKEYKRLQLEADLRANSRSKYDELNELWKSRKGRIQALWGRQTTIWET